MHFLFVFILSFLPCTLDLAAVPTPAKKTKALAAILKKSVVTISVHTTCSAYDHLGKSAGTGFVCDKKRGWIVTNRHVVGYGAVATYTITFFDGQKLDARLIYKDPWHDFAILALDASAHLPASVIALEKFNHPHIGEPVFMVGNNQGKGFSFQKAAVRSLYQTIGFLPEPGFSLTVNSRGGSSGSPIVNANLQLLGLNYAGNDDDMGAVLHSSLIQEALYALRKGRVPPRQHIGVICRLKDLNDPVMFQRLSKKAVQNYARKYPEAKLQALTVLGTLKGSPAEGILQGGDIIWAVNGLEIGPDLARFERLLNHAAGQTVRIAFFRDGTLMARKIARYDLHKMCVRRLLVFGGATFFEPDDQIRWQFNLSPGALISVHWLPGSSFSRALASSYGLGQHGSRPCLFSTLSFDAFVQDAPRLAHLRRFSLPVRWLTPTHTGYSGLVLYGPRDDTCHVHYAPAQNTLPELIVYNPQTHTWDVSSILCHGD